MYFLYVTNFFINMILIPENEKAGGLWFDGGFRYLGQCHSYDGMFALRVCSHKVFMRDAGL